MSLDIILLGEKLNSNCFHCGQVYKEDNCVYSANITHNLAKMALEAGLYEAMWRPDENNLKLAKDVLPYLKIGLDSLESNPKHFMKFNPSNGWGSYDNLLKTVKEYIKACEESPLAEVLVSR